MIKLVFAVRRLPHLSRAEFQRYWRETHGPLVARHAGVLGIRRYVQAHTIDDPANEALRASRDTMEAYDGTAELWWDGVEAMQATLVTPAARAAAAELLADERRFIDLPRCALWLAREHVVIDG